MPKTKGSEEIAMGPVFVVGMNGSGTTMLADCLDNSPELYVFPFETILIPWFIKNLNKFGTLDDPNNLKRLFLEFKNSIVFRRPVLSESSRLDDIREESFFGVMDAVYRELAIAHKSTPRWLEKSPMNVQYILEIAEHVPSAKFIHIHRDGRDVALSNARRFHHDMESTMYRWVQAVRRGRLDGSELGPDHYFELSYESLTNDPEPWMRKICHFIHIPYEDNLLRSGMPWLDGLGRNAMADKTGTITSNSGKWRSAIAPKKLVALERIGGKLLKELDYPTDFPDEEMLPKVWTKATWEIKDYAARLHTALANGTLAGRPGRRMKRWLERARYRRTQKF